MFELTANNLNEVSAEFDVLVVLLDRRLDVVDLGEGRITGAVLVALAEKVPVLIAVSVDGALLDETAIDVSLESTVPAPQASLQVVSVDTAAFTGDGSRLEHALHDIEEIRLNPTALSDEDLEHFRGAFGDSAPSTGQRAVAQKLRATPTFRERAIDLASRPDAEAVAEIIPSVESWARRLRDARNNLAHTGNENGDEDIFRLEWVTSSLIALVLMAELGLSPDTQRRAAKDLLKPPR
ncbi:hypothetical protein G3H63_13345 [Microbacterium resistens]|uniref:HEPN domain-containing protein n=1 Tax=Microbacterium resistens TaxID=156977 RepID=UPI001F1EFB2B|nr:HEPN domain-containing protein [Microbacterium resistens]MBW1640048.1 hypothetical protein [Microbacterium resistens]